MAFKKTRKQKKQYRKRLRRKHEILNNPNITHLYIIKRGLYYKPNLSGYTDFEYNAGIYPKKKYASHIEDDDFLVRAVNNEEHNQMILAKIEDLKTRII